MADRKLVKELILRPETRVTGTEARTAGPGAGLSPSLEAAAFITYTIL
jgi:hypothetical protein